MKKIKIAEPHNSNHIEKIEKFEQKNNISQNATKYLKNIKETTSKDNYQQNQHNSNEIQQIVFIEDNNEVKDYCHIQGEKDLKTCYITLAPIKPKVKNREILSLVTNYIFNYLGINDIFITAHDLSECETIENTGFTNLGENEGKIVFLKQKEDLIEYNKII